MAKNIEIRAGLYARVSTSGQIIENQLAELRTVAERRGWNVIEVYTDEGISGAKGRDKRPAFDRLLKDASRGKINLVAAWALDRIGRSLPHVVETLEMLKASKTALYLHQQQIDGTTPAGQALLGMSAVFAEFERAMLIERILAGQARARAAGKYIGGVPVPEASRSAVLAALSAPERPGYRAIAAACGVSIGTVAHIAKELAGAA
jgi:DNA invertase Pin-like site-specific DNA recombinase